MGFWGRGIDTPIVHPGEDLVSVEQAAKLSRCLPPNSPALTQAGIAWEYVWGQPPPKDIAARRHNLIKKARSGKKLNHEEETWLRLIQVDTDMF